LFYILSGIFNFFLAPERWIIILLIIAWITKRRLLRKRLLIVSVVIFILFSNDFIFTKFTSWWQATPVQLKDSAGYSAGILLGGISMTDKHKQQFLSESSDRFVQTLLLYKRGVIKKILVSGTNKSDKRSEAEFLRDLFVQAGVPAQDILVETKARNTLENVSFSKQVLLAGGATPPYIVITSAFHIRRSSMAFEKENVEVIMYPSAYINTNKVLDAEDYLVPKSEVMMKWRFLLKEMIGIVVYKISGKG